MPKTFACIIPYYKQKEYLCDAIESALNQTVPFDEIIVVDDYSPDDISILVKMYPTIKYYRHNVNSGLSATRNTGIRNCVSEWCVCLDADDKLVPNFIEVVSQIDDDIISVGWQEFGDNNRKFWTGRKHPTFDWLVIDNHIICSSPFKRKVWESVGGYDEIMKLGMEDYDFWLRALKKGFTITAIPDPLLLYRKHGQSMINNTQKNAQFIKNYMLTRY